MELRIGAETRLEIKPGESIFDTLKRNAIYLVSACGGVGTCGKCRVRIIEGDCEIISHGKLDDKEQKQGLTLACQTIPKGDLVIDIPAASRLIVGDKIAIARSNELLVQLKRRHVKMGSPVARIPVRLIPPRFQDNSSELERLKIFLREHGLDLSFSRDFVAGMARYIREENWLFNLCYEKFEKQALFMEPFSADRTCYGLAVDIGTTTVVMYLVDLGNGHVVDVGLTFNSQMRFGDDVISRVIHAERDKGLEELRQTIILDINILISSFLERHDIAREDIEAVVLSGNTIMTHLFWGINPQHIRKEPYIPTVQFFPVWSANEARLKVKGVGPVYTLPCVAGYMGADIVAGVLATGMHTQGEIALFIDIGTNGEIVAGNKEWLLRASCSAGPCFEGGVIKHGMRATEGAIETVKLDRESLEPELGIIGDTVPVGICGSGMIDAVSELFCNKIINRKGKFLTDSNTGRIREGEDGWEYLFYRGAMLEIVLTEVDIENIIRAKAAIYAGISLLMKEVGLALDAIEKFYVAGGFGNYLNIDKAIILGMLPDIPKGKFAFLGNTSVAGGYLCLLSEDLRREAEDIAAKMTCVELSISEKFMDEFGSAMFLPHTDISRFPTVKRWIR